MKRKRIAVDNHLLPRMLPLCVCVRAIAVCVHVTELVVCSLADQLLSSAENVYVLADIGRTNKCSNCYVFYLCITDTCTCTVHVYGVSKPYCYCSVIAAPCGGIKLLSLQCAD